MMVIKMRDLRSTLPVILLVALLAGCSSTPSTPTPDGLTESGTFTIRVNQILQIEAGGSGEGNLIFQGWQYPFTIENMTVRGVDKFPVDLEGRVYDLEKLEDFEGTYQPVKAEIEAGGGLTGLWTKNEKGVLAHVISQGQDVELNLVGKGGKVTLKK